MAGSGDPAATVLLWLDIFAIDQNLDSHADSRGNGTDAVAAVAECVAAAKRTLVCLDAEGAFLSRSWCLYEVG